MNGWMGFTFWEIERFLLFCLNMGGVFFKK